MLLREELKVEEFPWQIMLPVAAKIITRRADNYRLPSDDGPCGTEK